MEETTRSSSLTTALADLSNEIARRAIEYIVVCSWSPSTSLCDTCARDARNDKISLSRLVVCLVLCLFVVGGVRARTLIGYLVVGGGGVEFCTDWLFGCLLSWSQRSHTDWSIGWFGCCSVVYCRGVEFRADWLFGCLFHLGHRYTRNTLDTGIFGSDDSNTLAHPTRRGATVSRVPLFLLLMVVTVFLVVLRRLVLILPVLVAVLVALLVMLLRRLGLVLAAGVALVLRRRFLTVATMLLVVVEVMLSFF